MFNKILLAIIFIVPTANASSKLEIPVPTGVKAPADPEIKDLLWNHTTTHNFIIMGLDPKQVQYLSENIEPMKDWAMNRWGLSSDFVGSCKVMCVPSRELQKKIFNLDGSYGEVRRNKDGSISESVLWLVLDGAPSQTIPAALSSVCLQQLNVPFWSQRGISYLNATIPQIKGHLSLLEKDMTKDRGMFFSDKLFSMTEEEWRKLKVEERNLFDRESVALCLLLRKELGQLHFLRFITNSVGTNENTLQKIYGFSGYSEFDFTLKRYMYNLSKDVNNGKTPESYFQIKNAKTP